jgi:hypothetical protein
MERKRPSESGFRWLLILGAITTTVLAVWAIVWTSALGNILGLRQVGKALGLSRMYGGALIALAVCYALAAAQPQRSRALLVPLFVFPIATALTVIAGLARGEIRAGQGIAFVLYNLAYGFLYFRLYPRVAGPETDVNTSRNAEP